MQLFAASLAIFYAIHLFARPLPRTMTKEWQEATNEYAKVRIALLSLPRLFPVDALLTDHDPNSGRRSNPSPVSAARDTAARVTSRAPRPRGRRWDPEIGRKNRSRQEPAWCVDNAGKKLSGVIDRLSLILCCCSSGVCSHDVDLYAYLTQKYMYTVLCHSQYIPFVAPERACCSIDFLISTRCRDKPGASAGSSHARSGSVHCSITVTSPRGSIPPGRTMSRMARYILGEVWRRLGTPGPWLRD